MPQTSSRRRRRRPGKVARRVTRLVSERRRLLAVRDEITTAFEAEVAAMYAVYQGQVARIDAQLRALDRGVLPQPLRDDEDDGTARQPDPGPNGRIAAQLSGGADPC